MIARLLRDADDAHDVDVILALADVRSELGAWIRGDEPVIGGSNSIASVLFVDYDARVFLGSAPSKPGLVVLVVDEVNVGVRFRFISGAPRT